MTNRRDEILEENVARLVQGSALPSADDRMDDRFQDFLRKTLEDGANVAPRSIRWRSLPAALAASLISLAGVGWFLCAPPGPGHSGPRREERQSPAEASQDKPKAESTSALAARKLIQDLFAVVQRFGEVHPAEKQQGKAGLVMESLDVQESTTPGNEGFAVSLRGRILNLELLAELRRNLRAVPLLKDMDYKGSISPIEGEYYRVTLQASGRLPEPGPGVAPASRDDDPIPGLSSKAILAGLPRESLAYTKNPPARLGNCIETTYSVKFRAESPKNPISRAAVLDYLQRIESGDSGLVVKSLSLEFSGDLVVDGGLVASSFAPVPGRPFGGAFRTRLLAGVQGREVWGVDPAEIEWARQHQEEIFGKDFQFSAAVGGGLKIESVAPDSIGPARGLQEGDLLKIVNGKPVDSVAELKKILNGPDVTKANILRIELERQGKPWVLEYRPLPK